MQFFSTTSAASRRAGSCIVVGVYERGNPGIGAADVDAASKGLIRKHIKQGDISGKSGSSLLLTDVADTASPAPRRWRAGLHDGR